MFDLTHHRTVKDSRGNVWYLPPDNDKHNIWVDLVNPLLPGCMVKTKDGRKELINSNPDSLFEATGIDLR